MVKLWVIGSAGMVGSGMLQLCHERGIEAIGTTHAEVDVCCLEELKKWAEQLRPTHLINCAAYTNVDQAQTDEERAFALNALGAENVALAAKKVGARLIHLSTDYVFDGAAHTPYTEEDACAPLSVYGKSKLEGERRALNALSDALIVRTSWVFGPQRKNFITFFFERFFTEKTLKVVCDQVGKPTYCLDLCDALLSLLDASGIVHFSNEGGGSRAQIATSLLQLVQEKKKGVVCETILPALSRDFPLIAPRPAYSVLDTAKYTRLTHKHPRHWLLAAKEFLHGI